MKHSTVLIASTLALSSLFTGCVGTGPNTQQGAVTGGALGALAGAVIGNNSRGGNTLAGAAIGAAVGAVAGGTIGNSVDNQNGTVYGESGRPGTATVIRRGPPAPPAPLAESIPASPSPNAIWIPGYWDYNGAGYSWIGGHWEIAPALAHQYVAPHWEDRSGTFVFVRGYWR
jgi:YmgG-like glycine-zipper protein/YXWGXW repeat-containing protein